MSSGYSLDELTTATGESRDRLAEWQALGLLGEVGSDGRLPADAPLRARLVRLCVAHGIGVDAVATWVRTGEMDRHLALLAPGGPRPTYDLVAAAERLEVDASVLERLCRAIGFVPGNFDDEDLGRATRDSRKRPWCSSCAS